MRRFASLEVVPAETRRTLRDRFSRYLPTYHNAPVKNEAANTLSDEIALALVRDLAIEFGNELAIARSTYEAARTDEIAETDFDSLITQGWLRVVWGRVFVARDVALAQQRDPAAAKPAFDAFLARRFDVTYRFSDTARHNASVASVIDSVEAELTRHHQLHCASPEWVAARLWERLLAESPNATTALRHWIDRWRILGAPSLVPDHIWIEAVSREFCSAALSLFATEPGLLPWKEWRTSLIGQLALLPNHTAASADASVPVLPASVVDRSVLFQDHIVERAMYESLDAYDDILGLFRLLATNIEVADHAPPQSKLAEKLLPSVVEKPLLLWAAIMRTRTHPLLLVEMLLYPPTSSLACLLVAQWQPVPSAWDRELTARDDSWTIAAAFADAAGVVGHYLEKGKSAPSEAAELLVALHAANRRRSRPDLNHDHSMLDVMRAELVHLPLEQRRSTYEALESSFPSRGVGTPVFSAALDTLSAGGLADAVDPMPLVFAYMHSLTSAAYDLSAKHIGYGEASCLFHVAMRGPDDQRRKFLYPLEIKEQLLAADAAAENPYTTTDTIVRSLRVHIRVLSRAVAGLEHIPDQLAAALVASVRSGAISHKEKGRVPAFAARYEAKMYGPVDRPIAADIGAAITALAGDARSQLLAAMLETDEPLALAQLLAFVPYGLRSGIENRVRELTPTEAGEIRSLTEAQSRIEELLSAGLAESAQQYLNAERLLTPFGKVAGRDLLHFQQSLRLQLLRRDWGAIANAAIPANLSATELASASDSLAFYQAAAALTNPTGDRQAAEQLLLRLHQRHSLVAAYIINLFAAQIGILLGGDIFRQLDATDAARAREILSGAEQMMSRVRELTPAEQEIFACNKSLLLLALHEPEQAERALSSITIKDLPDRVAAYRAVAVSRLGRASEAIGILQHAKGEIGDTEVLQAAQAHIEQGQPRPVAPSITSENDPIPRIKIAFHDLLNLGPSGQARVLNPSDSLAEFLIGHVRGAAARVTALVPMMKGVQLDACEDDINSLMREMLGAQLQFLKWAVPDQSKGGYSAKENPGERDLLVKQDGYILATVEAVVCDQPIPRQTLTEHFQKLLGYSDSYIFFHLTYAYGADIGQVVAFLKETAAKDAPDGFQFVAADDIQHLDSRPTGFVARYLAGVGEIKVVFLVLDMGQRRQKAAAKRAGSKRNTKKPTNKGT